MKYVVKSFLGLIILFFGHIIKAQDVQPPQITKAAESVVIPCHDTQAMSKLQTWYNSAGNAMATDNSGEVSFIGFPSLDIALQQFATSADTLCGNNRRVRVMFFAVDPSGNRSSPMTAMFSTQDITKPIITKFPVNVKASCSPGAQDSLVSWIRNKGFANATDECSDVIWTRFVYNTSSGAAGTGDILAGPFPSIPSDACNWFMIISFFVNDACENDAATTGRYELTDTTAPVLSARPLDIDVDCNNIPSPPTITATDACDKNVNVIYSQLILRDGEDMDSCDYYNYTIERTWEASDECGNSVIHTQMINVTDNSAPILHYNPVFETANCLLLSEDSLFLLIDSVEECSNYVLNFQDTTSQMGCLTLVTRTYNLIDICGNTSSFEQLIRIQDSLRPVVINPPSALEIQCGDTIEIESRFTNWLQNLAGANVQDFCSSVTSFVAVKGSYDLDDTSSYPGILPEFNLMQQCPSDKGGFSIYMDVDFVFYDQCGNAVSLPSFFGIRDSVPPTILFCLDTIRALPGLVSCQAMVQIILPEASDACSIDGRVLYSIAIDGGDFTSVEFGDELDTVLSVGIHTALIQISDCAGNISTCEQIIEVLDDLAPEIFCPDTLIGYAGLNSCEAELLIPLDFEILDNCTPGLVGTFSNTSPLDSQFISFLKINDSVFVAQPKIVILNNLPVVRFTDKPVEIEVQLIGDLNEDMERFNVIGEDGSSIGQTNLGSGTTCTTSNSIFTLSVNQYNNWIEDGNLILRLEPISSTTAAGINPCGTVALSGLDSISRSRVLVRVFDYPISAFLGLEDMTPIEIGTLVDTLSVTIGAGNSQILFRTSDQYGLDAECIIHVEIIDTIAPVLQCDSIVLTALPNGMVSSFPDSISLMEGVMDNCGIDSIWYVLDSIDCNLVGSDVGIEVFARDLSGNIGTCSTDVFVVPFVLEAGFTAGVCAGDSLKFFTNLDSADLESYSFEWYRDGEFFSALAEPILTNADTSINGIYSVTVTGAVGCSISDTFNVRLQVLSSPQITTNQVSFCEGETLLLQSTLFSGSITYQWYEGRFPDGDLLVTGPSPSLQIQPEEGPHFYYVIAQGGTCTSNPSPAIRVDAYRKPVAQVLLSEISVCAGEDIMLGSTTLGAGLVYKWVGPAGYSSSLKDPLPILNVGLQNSGTYSLTISRGLCESDLATTQVSVAESPSTPVLVGASSYCQGNTLVLSATGSPGTELYRWFLNGQLFRVTQTNALEVENAQQLLSGGWQVVAISDECSSDTSAVKVVSIDNVFEVGAENSGPGCEGDSIRLSATFIPNASYFWSGPNNFQAFSPEVNAFAAPGVYTVRITTQLGCESTATTEVDVFEKPRITALSNTSKECMDGMTNVQFFPSIFPTGDYSYQWSGPNNFTSTELNAIIEDADESDNGEYTLSVFNGECPSDPVSNIIAIKDIPVPPSISGPESACIGSRVVLFASDSADSYEWSTPRGTVITIDSFLAINFVDASHAGSYFLKLNVSECGTGASDTFKLSIVDNPPPPIIQGPTEVCGADSLILTAVTSFGDSDVVWSRPNGATFIGKRLVLTGANIVGGTYRARIETLNCTSDLSNPHIVTVQSEIKLPRFLDYSFEACKESLSEVRVCIAEQTITPGAMYIVTNEEDGMVVSKSEALCHVIPLDVLNTGRNSFRLGATNGLCTNMDTSVLVIHIEEVTQNSAQIAMAEQPFIICDEVNPIDLQVLESDSGLTYTWISVGNALNLSNATGDRTTVSGFDPGTALIILRAENVLCGVTFRDTATFVFEAIPVLADDQVEVQINSSNTLRLLDNDEIPGENVIEVIEISHGSLVYANDIFTYTPPTGFVGAATARYRVCIPNCPERCDEALVQIEVGLEALCQPPTIITPNGDGINDLFIVSCLDGGNYPNSSLTIFNEWGDQIFKSSPYRNNWGGTFEGKDLPVGTYFYVFRLNQNSDPTNGFLMIQR